MKHVKSLFFGDYKSFSSEKDYKSFFIANLFVIIGILIHILYIGIFVHLGINQMAFAESLSVVALIVAGYINRKRIKNVPALIMCIEIGANGVIWAVMLNAGASHYLYTFVALLAAFLFLELGRKQKVFITLFLLISVNISHSVTNIGGIDIAEKHMKWLAFLSLNMVFLLLTIELTINEITNEALKEMHKKTVRRMESEIVHDPLTQLYNRRYFRENEESFNQIREQQIGCVAMMDLDHFKSINDTYGHDAGDKVLVFFADKLRNELDASDVIIRWGGEEFLVLFYDASIEAVISKLNRFRDKVKGAEVQLEEEAIKVTFTAGLCKVEAGMTVSESITQADNLLYHGKAFGRDCICYR